MLVPTFNLLLDRLHNDYAALDLRPLAALTLDHRRSLVFYRGEHAMIAATAVPPEIPFQVINWLLTLVQLEAFLTRNHRWPRENRRLNQTEITSEERRLAAWIRTQRTGEALRCDYQMRRLECLPGFHWHPLDDRWDEHVIEYQFFTETHRRAPLVSSNNPAERTLASFAAKARLAYRRGRLPAHRIATLERLDFWTWGTTPRS
jgi:hypothetical protein